MQTVDPWARRDDEVRIKLVNDYPYKFTRKWFIYRNLTTFSTFLMKRFPNDKPWKGIQIGVFEGMDLVWQMQNIYSHPDSRVLAIDPWEQTTKLDQAYMNGVEDRARHNLRKWRYQIDIRKGYSQEVLQDFIIPETSLYDLVIIDGDHNADPAYRDACLVFDLVKPGGWILFDDVRNRIPKADHVQKALDCFLEDYEDEVKLVWEHRFCSCVEKLPCNLDKLDQEIRENRIKEN